LWPHVQSLCWCYCRAGLACTVHNGSNILHSIALLVAAESGQGTSGHGVLLLSLSRLEAIIAIFSEVDRLKNTLWSSWCAAVTCWIGRSCSATSSGVMLDQKLFSRAQNVISQMVTNRFWAQAVWSNLRIRNPRAAAVTCVAAIWSSSLQLSEVYDANCLPLCKMETTVWCKGYSPWCHYSFLQWPLHYLTHAVVGF